MILKYNRDSKLEIVGIGIFSPGFECRIDDEILADKYLKTGYFDEIKVKNNLAWGMIKYKSKPFDDLPEIKNDNIMIPKVSNIRSNIKIKKSKKKGDDKLCQ